MNIPWHQQHRLRAQGVRQDMGNLRTPTGWPFINDRVTKNTLSVVESNILDLRDAISVLAEAVEALMFKMEQMENDRQ